MRQADASPALDAPSARGLSVSIYGRWRRPLRWCAQSAARRAFKASSAGTGLSIGREAHGRRKGQGVTKAVADKAAAFVSPRSELV